MTHLKDVHQILETTKNSLYIESLKKERNGKGENVEMQKLKWTGKPEQFGFIFLELAKKGFIEIPSTNGEASYAKFAKVCFDLFEFESETTSENLKRVLNPEKNALSASNRKKFTIPNKNDIS